MPSKSVLLFVCLLAWICCALAAIGCPGLEEKLDECIKENIIRKTGPTSYEINTDKVKEIQAVKDDKLKDKLTFVANCQGAVVFYGLECTTKEEEPSAPPAPSSTDSPELSARAKVRAEYKKKALAAFTKKVESTKTRLNSMATREVRAQVSAKGLRFHRLTKRKRRQDANKAREDAAIAAVQLQSKVLSPALVRSGLDRTRSLVKLAVAARDGQGGLGGPVVRVGPKRIEKYLLEGPRYATVVALISAKSRYPATCQPCRLLTDTFYNTAAAVAQAQGGLWNSTAAMAIDADAVSIARRESDGAGRESVIRVPASATSPSGANLPLIFVELDVDDNFDIFSANQITSAPSIIVFPPTLTEKPLQRNTFLANAPAHHKPTTSFGFSTSDFLTFLQGFMRDTDKGPQQTLTAIQSASNPLVDFLSALPVPAWLAAAAVFVLVFSFALKHAAALISFLSLFKPLLALLAMAFFAFNCGGGLFGKVSGKKLEFWPPQLLKALSVNALVRHVERWVSPQFRDQYFGEGVLVAATCFLFALMMATLVELALARSNLSLWNKFKAILTMHKADAPFSVHNSIDVLYAKQTEAASTAAASVSAISADSATPASSFTSSSSSSSATAAPSASAPAKSLPIILSLPLAILHWIVLGIAVPLALLTVSVFLYFLVVRMFMTKMPSYAGEVLWTHQLISTAINRALAYLQTQTGINIAYQVPSLLFTMGK